MKNIKFYEHQKNVFLPGETRSRTTQHSPQDERGPPSGNDHPASPWVGYTVVAKR